jgi:hypothetical protein
VELTLVRVDGAVETLGSVESGGQAPRFVAGTDGAPLLWDGSFRRFDPWNATLEQITFPPAFGAEPGLDPFPLGPGVIAVTVTKGLDLAFSAMRFDVRNPLTIDGDLGLGSTAHLVPDRHAGMALTRDGLTLPPSARLTIADTDYGAFTLRIGGSGRDLPAVELRNTESPLAATFGAESCPWPVPAAPETSATLTRDADGGVSLRVGDETRSCASTVGTTARVTISFVASSTGALLRGVTASRAP